jgi:hypothetical protein
VNDRITRGDENKPVLDANGDRLGTVDRVEDGTAFVEPSGDVPPLVGTVLGWTGDDETFPLSNLRVDTVTDEEVHLRSNL